MRKRNLIIVAIILMAVGFATLTTNLIINGNVAVSNNKSDYDIKFTKAILDERENNSLITSNGIEINYETKQLTNVGDKSELVYEISNNSSQYDAEVSINCVPTSTIMHTNLYTINTTNTPKIIKAKRSESGSIEVRLKEVSTESIKENFKCTLTINALERTSIGKPIYKEEQLNGTDPVVKEGLIPVKLSSTGVVTMADTSEEWYNYGNKEWANAVILMDTAKAYNVGDVIEETDIESYFVWIPKYKYKLFNVNSPDGTTEKLSKSIAHTIEIEFGIENTTDIEGKSCVTPMISGESGSCNNGEFMTHPAFISMGTTGLWVGKFETGYKGSASVSDAQVNNANSSNIIVKPNVYSWRNSTVGNFFKAMYNYKRDLNSHMMKNTEWGAVAYLSHSKYGINTEVRINNHSNFLTGYAANTKDGVASATENQPYNTEIGYLASTTGNISGVYDMSGGTWEYVAAVIDNSPGNSGLTISEISEIYKGYFDIYPLDSNTTTYSNRILGDATGEMGSFYNETTIYRNNWYLDYAVFIVASNALFQRGGGYTNEKSAGQFYFAREKGANDNFHSARLALSF